MGDYSTSACATSAQLLKRLERDMLSCHHQMEVLKIIFKNLERSWLALSLAHKIVKDEVEEGH
jgi:hypothetical protein